MQLPAVAYAVSARMAFTFWTFLLIQLQAMLMRSFSMSRFLTLTPMYCLDSYLFESIRGDSVESFLIWKRIENRSAR